MDRRALTPRQLQVYRLHKEGLTAKAIAQRLGIATATVKTHLAHLRRLGWR